MNLCRDCRFWDQFKAPASAGFCRRYPPVYVGTFNHSAQWFLPQTDDSDWCGEWAGKQEVIQNVAPQEKVVLSDSLCLNVSDVSRKLNLSKATVWKHIHDGTIPAIHIGSRWVVPTVALARFLESAQWPITPQPQRSNTSSDVVISEIRKDADVAMGARAKAVLDNIETFPGETLSIPQASKVLGISDSTVRSMAWNKKLPGARQRSGRIIINKAELEAALRSGWLPRAWKNSSAR